MGNTDIGQVERELYELTGALDAIYALKEKLELRQADARDDCVREVLDNVIFLVDAHEIEYRRRLDECRARLQSSGQDAAGQ